MGFCDINYEQKVRMSLSKKARIIMNNDMNVFGLQKTSTFVNIVFENFYEQSKASLYLYMLRKHQEYTELFEPMDLDELSIKKVIKHMELNEKREVTSILKKYMTDKSESQLFHINNNVRDYLQSLDCKEEVFYHYKPGAYIKCVIEEYAELPFIQRERIFRKDIFDIVESACETHSLMQVKTKINGIITSFIVYPYNIIPDTLNTQLYLTCFTRKPEQSSKEKVDASFSMIRLEKPRVLNKKSFLSKDDIAKIENDIENLSVTFLLGDSHEIHVQLTVIGQKMYQTMLFSRPDKDERLSHANEYVFFCSEYQAYIYFLPFASEAEIISPVSLRAKMIQTYSNALQHYK